MEIFHLTNSINRHNAKKDKKDSPFVGVVSCGEKTVGRSVGSGWVGLGPCPRLNQKVADKEPEPAKPKGPDQGKISAHKTRATCATATCRGGWLRMAGCSLPGR